MLSIALLCGAVSIAQVQARGLAQRYLSRLVSDVPQVKSITGHPHSKEFS
jgi:hypothetical protein